MEKVYSITKLSNYIVSNYKNKFIITKENNQEYIQIPSYIFLKFNNNSIIFCSEKQFKNEFMQFISILESFLTLETKNKFVKRLKIHGLGYKILKEEEEENALFLNLGYSEPIKIEIPSQISNIIIKKTVAVFESFDKVFLGNFVNSLCSLKKCDIYKGKGFILEYNKTKLKIIKKK